MQVVSIPGGNGTPYRLNSLPQDAFAHPGWVRVEQQALQLIADRRRLLLLGRAGTGKSLLLRSLNRTLANEGKRVQYLHGGDLTVQVAEEVVLLIDEAASLSVTQLEWLVCCPNALVMAGLPNLPERLSLEGTIFQRLMLEPLTSEEVTRFIVAQTLANGRPRDTFTSEALATLARESDGLLRLVIVLAGAALFFAEQRGAAQVTVDDVNDAAAMRCFPQEKVDQSDTSDEALVRPDLLGQGIARQMPGTGPLRFRLFLSRRRLERIAGLTVWACSSIAVIGIATLAALSIKPLPSLMKQEPQFRLVPRMAEVPMPALALAPVVQSATPTIGQMAVALPPARAETPPPLRLTPVSPPDTSLPDALSSWPEPVSKAPAVQALAAKLPIIADPADQSATVLSFAGLILNTTMKQGGQLSLQFRFYGAHGQTSAVFHASQGLIGSGTLMGDIGVDGRITLSGRLMMGRNPFDCMLQATLESGHLVGRATFVRASSGAVARSVFELSRL